MLEYKSIEELCRVAREKNCKLSELVLDDQAESMELPREELYRRMEERFAVMESAVKAGMNPELRSTSNLTDGDAAKM